MSDFVNLEDPAAFANLAGKGNEVKQWLRENAPKKADGYRYVILDDVPDFIGEGALEVSKIKFGTLQDASEKNLAEGRAEAAKKLDKSAEMATLLKMDTFRPNEPLKIGNFTVTPFFCSHSAFDSYMFLIEAEGKKVLHTGDFRDHGYLGKGLNKFIPAFVGQVDALITEGTMLSRGAEHVDTEAELKVKAQRLLTRKTGSHQFFALCSSTDIDRLVTFHHPAAAVQTSFVPDEIRGIHHLNATIV